MSRPGLCCVIVNYKTPALTLDCVASLFAGTLLPDQVIVVDNNSQDGSYEHILHHVQRLSQHEEIAVIPAATNAGFGAGNNLGFQHALQGLPGLTHVVLINPDATAHPELLATLMARFDHSPNIGIVGGAIVDEQGRSAPAAHTFPSALGELERGAEFGPLSKLLAKWRVTPEQPTEAAVCDWVSGACMAIRRETYSAVQGFDEEFFLYFEEVDFCARAAKAGWACWYEPLAVVTHLEGASTGIKALGQRRPGYWYDSRRRLLVKLHGVTGLILSDLLWLVGRGSLAIRRALGLGGRAGLRHQPASEARDLFVGDWRALASGQLHRQHGAR